MKEGANLPAIIPPVELPVPSEADTHVQDIRFGMNCNGYHFENGDWKFYQGSTDLLTEEFEGQGISYFGPSQYDSFFSERNIHPREFIRAFDQPEVGRLIGRYRRTDQDLASRLSFILGGIIRHLNYKTAKHEDIAKSVGFAAKMSLIGSEKSADAIASSMAMYIISGGSIYDDNNFAKRVYRMSEAIDLDPVEPKWTKDLGLSQVARLRGYSALLNSGTPEDLPDISQSTRSFRGFPTVGAEFHFPVDIVDSDPNLWKRLAILNMSQYQRGSFIQMSRNDRGVIEVRMNPSTYPIATANWNWLRRLIPELSRSYFWITLNRPQQDFSWEGSDDTLIEKLRGVGLLNYVGIFEDVPAKQARGEINFGQLYLGQTVRLRHGEWEFSGAWSGTTRDHGQLSIYAGFGETFHTLAYNLSMALANPDILKSVKVDLASIQDLHHAFSIDKARRRLVFTTLQNQIERNERLGIALREGEIIIKMLSPD